MSKKDNLRVWREGLEGVETDPTKKFSLRVFFEEKLKGLPGEVHGELLGELMLGIDCAWWADFVGFNRVPN